MSSLIGLRGPPPPLHLRGFREPPAPRREGPPLFSVFVQNIFFSILRVVIRPSRYGPGSYIRGPRLGLIFSVYMCFQVIEQYQTFLMVGTRLVPRPLGSGPVHAMSSLFICLDTFKSIMTLKVSFLCKFGYSY